MHLLNLDLMLIRRLQIEESTKPVRLSQQLEKAVANNYKPVSNHSYNVSVYLYELVSFSSCTTSHLDFPHHFLTRSSDFTTSFISYLY